MRMKFSWLSSWPSRLTVVAALSAVPGLAAADTFSPGCNLGGDQFGYSIATNGDFNGDGVNDIAVGAPCLFVGRRPHAGRVVVFDGRWEHRGKRLFIRRGRTEHQWFGASVSFIPDLDGDARDEIAIGSPGYDVTVIDQNEPSAKLKDRAGRIDVFSRRKRRMRVLGSTPRAGFGEKIAPLNDINGDGRADFLVSATGDRNEAGTTQDGRVWLVSGKNGDLLGYRVGPREGNGYGRSLATAADLDGDGLLDFLTGTDTSNGPSGVLNAGVMHAISSADLQGTPLFQTYGAHRDRLGKSLDFAGDVNGDGVPEAIVGSGGSDDSGLPLSGLVSLISFNGTRLWTRQDAKVQEGARFGEVVANVGDLNGDGVTDFAATAPRHDYLFNNKLAPDCGRLVTLSGVDGEIIWVREGERRHEQLGFSLDGHIDFDLDEVPDMVVGIPGDDPFGRRGAGSVRILSGVDGTEIYEMHGRRGLETRLFVLLPDDDDNPRLRSFTRTGRRTEMNQEVLENTTGGEMSAAVINDNPFNAKGDPHLPRPKQVHVASSGGYGAEDSTVEIYRVSKVKKLINSFEAFPGENFGVECGAGEVNGRVNEDLVCAQADSADGNVSANIFERLDEEAPFFLSGAMQVFSSTDMYGGVLPINAEGANIEVGDVTGDKAEEIIAGTTRGVPLVKIFSREGVLIRSFLAYDPVDFSGVDIGLVDLNGSGDQLIVTAPREGNALIKVFNGNGDRVTWGQFNTPINIMVRGGSYDGGARVTAADVDRDDQQEILVLIPSPDGEHLVYAYEPTNQLVPTTQFNNPFVPLPEARTGGAIAATDRWTRN
ncbi:MAG: FG-GAP-like repeat-containing protein [Candidatus Binatia bacterium]